MNSLLISRMIKFQSVSFPLNSLHLHRIRAFAFAAGIIDVFAQSLYNIFVVRTLTSGLR